MAPCLSGCISALCGGPRGIILAGMWTATLLLVAASFGQSSPEAEGLKPYVFTFKNGDDPLYALVDEGQLRNVSFDVLIDTPWNKQSPWEWRKLQRSIVGEMSPDEPIPLAERTKQAWIRAGGVQITDRDGRPYWVLKSDQAKQQRASEFEQRAFSKAVPAAAEVAPRAGEMKDAGAEGPGVLRLWGAHAAVIGAAVLLAGAVLWGAFRKSWSPVWGL